MARSVADNQFLENEAIALLTRLDMVKPFALNTPMVRAAAISAEAQNAINELINKVSLEVKQKVNGFISWLKSPTSQQATAAEAQTRYSLLKLRFNNLLDQLDIFADVLSQRGEHSTGVWLAGLDVMAMDALALPGGYYHPPPLVCFLDRGHGAAIRRARTRLPGGDSNPVGVIQVPRERLVGSGIASSLIHEVGHQGSDLLNLIDSVRGAINLKVKQGQDVLAWQLLSRWISEILSDFWAMAHIGIGATTGLIGVVGLPSYFVFRIGTDGPHPFPWIRVKISIAFGKALYPHPQWQYLEKQWESFYPTKGLEPGKLQIINSLEKVLPEFANLLINHKPASLKGKLLKDIFPYKERQPARLQELYQRWRHSPQLIESAAPTLVFAVLGQAKSDRSITAGEESRVLQHMLTRWALLRAQHYCITGKRNMVEAVQQGELHYSKKQLQLI
ncbi:hypothetical protein AAE02nite_46070 [Adhaeribacter aerolatus]|uniref:Uncharacterized protein n=1 Tax=Adhaeribacter aerolatus TaxID=670289 RepID=A0A512B4P8_9BACT|nr:hypothetical protein [Adhaeribacter aerolatus]GEO06943.1 hypothetical protein AAE02nite_46070 [Adhaeribacter aerolatus]